VPKAKGSDAEAAAFAKLILEEESRRPQLKQSLRRVVDACNLLENIKAPITVAAVAKWIAEHSDKGAARGPTAGTIRNQPDVLVRYIRLRAAAQSLPEVFEVDRGIRDRIRDPRLKEYVFLLEARAERLSNERNILLANFRRLEPISLMNLERSVNAENPSIEREVRPNLQDACKTLLSKSTLEKLGLEIVEINSEPVLLQKYRREVILWSDALKALAAEAGIKSHEVRALIELTTAGNKRPNSSGR